MRPNSKTLPECFKPRYRCTTYITDGSEVFTEWPTSLLSQSQTCSNYKSHNTVKFLITISTTGAITFDGQNSGSLETRLLRQFSVFITSVGLAQACPNNLSLCLIVCMWHMVVVNYSQNRHTEYIIHNTIYN